MRPLGVYFHIPFCATTCDFCAFYQEGISREKVAAYLDGMEAELALLPPNRPVETAFWGGGTPLMLPPAGLERLGHALLARAGGQPVEWTVEAAPASVTGRKLDVLRELGVNRLSMGVQSFDPHLLDALGRQHNLKQIYQAWDMSEATCFETRNLDLIFAIPGQTRETLRADLEAALALEPDSLSLYCLTFEEDTALYLRLSEGKVRRDDERDADLYEFAWDFLGERGYAHYEISNFCRPGKACLHNQRTWQMADWLGYGPAAASQFADQRWTNLPDLDGWAQGLRDGQPRRIDTMPLDPATRAVDRLIFGLRTGEGIDLDAWQRDYPEAPQASLLACLDQLCAEDLATRTGAQIRLTRQGKLLADTIGSALLEAAPAPQL